MLDYLAKFTEELKNKNDSIKLKTNTSGNSNEAYPDTETPRDDDDKEFVLIDEQNIADFALDVKNKVKPIITTRANISLAASVLFSLGIFGLKKVFSKNLPSLIAGLIIASPIVLHHEYIERWLKYDPIIRHSLIAGISLVCALLLWYF